MVVRITFVIFGHEAGCGFHTQLFESQHPQVAIEQIVKLEKEMNQVHTQYKDAEQNYGSDLLNLVVAKGYLTKLLANEAVKSYIQRHEPEILEQFELVVNTVSMEEAVQQKTEMVGADVGETSELG